MKNKHIESMEQANFFIMAKNYLDDDQYLVLWASMGGEKFKTKMQAVRAKRQGNKRGVPDICLAWPANNYHGLFIEMKRPENKILGVKKGYPSKDQKNMIVQLNKLGYMACIAWGADDAMRILREYVGS